MPALRNGCVTFGCFNKLVKVSPPLRQAWFRFFKEIRDNILVLRAHEFPAPLTREGFGDLAAAAGIAPSRLVLLSRDVGMTECRARDQQIALALDTWS
ncbi:MAG: hypothetical protein HKO62_05620 [Gammaproteobacteria bacterium]|nr:hypothetical protein [Gammaproteobacteria bacterium]